jgi:predicted  nucleic acid-binding Zn-ribbon protein
MTDGSDRMPVRPDRRYAEQEYQLYKRHGRPSRPYYGKCLGCGDSWEVDGTLLDADFGARRHAGYHGGFKEEHAQVVVTDSCGRELFRLHALFKPDQEPQGCPGCGERVASDRIACSNCGHIPEEDRLVPDGGTVESGSDQSSAQLIPLDESDGITLPIVEILTGRGFITGKSGSGKSNSASVIVEELLDRGFPVLIVDTDGEYWGLKEEYEILHVGADEECDLQVGPEHAEKLAELALEQSVPIILDVSGYLDEDEGSALVRETASALFAKEKKLNKPFLMLVEEIHEFIPETAGSDETARMLTRVAKRGRKRGLGLCGMSQRPADVKKDFITQCDWLMWHRLTWENDTKVVGRVIGNDYREPVQDLGDGEAFLMADFLEADVERARVRRKRTYDAGATPGLDDYERPDLKSVSGDLVDELEEISEREEQRQDRIDQLEAEVEDREDRIEELEQKLENQEDIASAAQQMAEALSPEDDGERPTPEVIEEKNARIAELEGENDELRSTVDDLRDEVDSLREQLGQRPDINERAVEAVDVLAEEFEVGDSDNEALRRKLKNARERIEELEDRQESSGEDVDLESDPLENRKVQTVVRDIESRLSDLGEKERKMLRYYLLNGPTSMKEAYKYAGGSPTSGAKSAKTRMLREAGLVKKVGRGEYDFGLLDHLSDVLSGFSGDELDRVYDHLESEVYDLIMGDSDDQPEFTP